MDGNGNENQAANVEGRAVDTVILTYDRATDHLDIGGHASSLDKMLDMLSRAQRVLEARWRMQQLQVMQQQAADAALAAKVRETIRH